ncbi:hypothetical protein FQR65_LT19624 [Abscondita terminalis]|nr:hypothetical protein FQR65_LT19624 [Abscondita terminalis]
MTTDIGLPLWLLAELTYRCPLQCPYCSNPLDYTQHKNELTTQQWCDVFDQARQLGAVQLGFSGGEPLVRRDLEQLVAHAHQQGFYTNLITSGMGLTEQRASDPLVNDALAGSKYAFEQKYNMCRIIKKYEYPMAFNQYRGDAWMPEGCRTCPDKDRDFGGCRCQAYMLTGNASNADPVCAKSPYHHLIEQARAETEQAVSLRLRSIGPLWNRPSQFGHGLNAKFPHSPNTGPGLTVEGKALIARCADKKMLVDVSHMNERAFWDTAEILAQPIVATHSNAYGLCPQARNLTDTQLKAIA